MLKGNSLDYKTVPKLEYSDKKKKKLCDSIPYLLPFTLVSRIILAYFTQGYYNG